MIEALDEGKLAGLGLDVLEDERVFRGGATRILGEKIAERVRSADAPVPRETSSQRVAEFSEACCAQPAPAPTGCRSDSHVAFNSYEALERLNAITVENIQRYLENRPLANCCT